MRRPGPAVSSCGSSRARSCRFARSRRHRRPRRPSSSCPPKRKMAAAYFRPTNRQQLLLLRPTVPDHSGADLGSHLPVAVGTAGSIALDSTTPERRPICEPWSFCCGSGACIGWCRTTLPVLRFGSLAGWPGCPVWQCYLKFTETLITSGNEHGARQRPNRLTVVIARR